MPSTKPARGMRDFLPADVRRRQHVVGVIADVYQRYGFEPLETPALENIETLLGKYGEEGDKLIFKILKRGEGEQSGGADLALRYDLTVPLARVVAEHGAQLPRLFKRYQIQPVWRADRPQRGRFREFYQCDVDAIGSTSPVVEAELCAAVSETLHALGFENFTVPLNHRGLLTALLADAGIAPELHGGALITLDKLDKVGPDEARAELRSRGVENGSTERLLAWPRTLAPAEWFAWAATVEGRLDEHGRAALENVSSIVRLSERTQAGPRLVVDLTLARGLSYYTGAIFEVKVPDLAGSLGGGGRYDNLVGMFSSQPVPAAGFSLGLERILVVMTERNMFPAGAGNATIDVLVALWSIELASAALELAAELRRAGLRVEVYPDPDKLGKQFKYASARDFPFVAVLGDEEIASGAVSIKNLRTGEQVRVARTEAASAIARGRA